MDDATLAGRLKRYLKVSGAVTGLASRLAGEKYLGIEIDRDQHAAHLRALLGGLKGPLMKVGQFLATVPGALPKEYADELMELQANAPAMGWAFVRRRMANELGDNWRSLFLEFAQEAAAAASLGQVHKAVTADHRVVACKLQYPDMENAIMADLNQLNAIFSFYETWNKAIQTDNIRQEIAERLEEELDYQREAENLRLYGQIFAHHPRIQVPEIVPELSTKRLLTMSWLEGKSLLTYLEAPQSKRDDIGQLLFKAWYHPFYHYGIIHGDPHPGNYQATEAGDLNLLDLGCIRHFSGKFIKGVIDLYHALQKNDRDQAVHAYESWGFQNLSNEAIEIVTHWARLLYEPLLDDSVRLIQNDLDGLAGWETATKVHEELNRIGGIRPPREFVFMDRAAVGIGSVLMRLQTRQNWHQLFNEMIADFSEDAVNRRKQELTETLSPSI